MKPSEIFAIVVRTVGLLIGLHAVVVLLATAYLLVVGGFAQSFLLAFFGMPLLVISSWMLRGAPGLIAFAYPEEKQYPKDPQELMDWMTSDKNV